MVPYRRGNKPPVLPGEGNERSDKKAGELKASPKSWQKNKPPGILVNGLATALPGNIRRFKTNEKSRKK